MAEWIDALVYQLQTSYVKIDCKSIGSPPFLHKPIIYTLGPTQPIQHTIVSSRAYYSTIVVLHEAVMYDTGNRSNTRRFCTCFDQHAAILHSPQFTINRLHTSPIQHNPFLRISFSTQPVSTHQFFSTKLVLHNCSQFLHTNISQVGKVGRRYGLPTRFPYLDIFFVWSIDHRVAWLLSYS